MIGLRFKINQAILSDKILRDTYSMDFRTKAQEVIRIEEAAIALQSSHLSEDFNDACRMLFDTRGRIVVVGMGKSGHIAGKIAATLASTGSPAFFMHAAEALHGDLGMITSGDTVLALSNSGKTPELLTLVPVLRQMGIPLIALTGNADSSLAKGATYHISVSVEEEACPLGLAPTASSTAALVMGDAIAVALLSARGFTREAFALSHPAGNLGKRLLLKVADFMHAKDAIPKVGPDMFLPEALIEMTSKRLGMTTVVDEKNSLLGIFTDGDLRRAIQAGIDLHQSRIKEVMVRNPKHLKVDDLASYAFDLMETHKITSLPVVDEMLRASS